VYQFYWTRWCSSYHYLDWSYSRSPPWKDRYTF